MPLDNFAVIEPVSRLLGTSSHERTAAFYRDVLGFADVREGAAALRPPRLRAARVGRAARRRIGDRVLRD
jgi:hypothetical protein